MPNFKGAVRPPIICWLEFLELESAIGAAVGLKGTQNN
jgi:hypothetical protein